MAKSIDEEGGCAVDATPHAAEKIFPHAWRVHMAGQFLIEPRLVEPERCGVRRQGMISEHALVLEERIVHFPEPPLSGGGVCRLRRVLSMWMNLGERKIPEDEAQTRAELFLNLFNDWIGAPAMGTLIVAVLDQRHGGVG